MFHRITPKDCLSLLRTLTPLYQKCSIQVYNMEIYAKELKGSDLRRVLAIRSYLLAQSSSVPLALENQLILKLLSDKSFRENAFKISKELLEGGNYPAPNILQKLINIISDEGRLDWLKSIEGKLPTQLVRDHWYTNKVVHTYLNANQGDILVRDILPKMRPFPTASLLAVLLKYPHHDQLILRMALAMCVPPDYPSAAINNVWIFYVLKKRWHHARNILTHCPKLRRKIFFSPVIEEARSNCDVELVRGTIDLLVPSDLPPRSVALMYSTLIEILIDQGKIDDAEDVILSLEKETCHRIDSQTGEKIAPVTLENMNRVTVIRLYNKIVTEVKRKARFDLTLPDPHSSGPSSSVSSI